jgi:hypothetical protein
MLVHQAQSQRLLTVPDRHHSGLLVRRRNFLPLGGSNRLVRDEALGEESFQVSHPAVAFGIGEAERPLRFALGVLERHLQEDPRGYGTVAREVVVVCKLKRVQVTLDQGFVQGPSE